MVEPSKLKAQAKDKARFSRCDFQWFRFNQLDREGGRVHPTAVDLLPSLDCKDRLDGLSVLVVDDEPDTREMLKLGLENCGAHVRLAGSATEALTAIGAVVPDVLISDIGMPGDDGYELIRKVRSL